MKPKLPPHKRRALILAALSPGANISSLARGFGIRRENIYQLVNAARTNPKDKLKEAEQEAEFRRRVLELVE